ncbi:hypothetical protein R4Z09_19590 [Niallia oryzisoli]|uniref:ATP synthase F0 subunit 8 n=1 Tax=Niallia oryzisoli TaxID=1737571 RepID=A0ABZ2C8T5_9BACI
MDWWFYITFIIGLSLLYYGHENKKKYELQRRTMELEHELKMKEMELEQKRLDLEMKKIENDKSVQNLDNGFEEKTP